MAAKKHSNSEVKAGLFLFVCLAGLIALLFFYGDFIRYWRGRQTLSVLFASVTSLRPEAPVRYNGVELGRVKAIQIVHLNEPLIKHMPPLTRADIDKLPLTEQERKETRKLEDDKIAGELKRLILKRTMIKLDLEVITENDTDRFRQDDDVHIATTLMGDTSIEIASGCGTQLASDILVLGRSGDFFTNLARSVEQVREILSSVSDVVGKEERESVRNALRRFDGITKRVQKVVEYADDHLPGTWDRVDSLADGAQKNLKSIGAAVDAVQPQVNATLKNASEAVTDLRGKIGNLADEAKDAVVEVRKDVKPIFGDIQYITSKSKDDIPAMVRNAKDLAARFQLSADKLDNVLSSGDRMLQESYPDVRRLVLALRLGAENFEEGTNVLKRKPWLIYNPAKEDPVANNAQRTAHDLERATKNFAELSVQLQAVRRNLDKAPKERLEKIDYILQELNILNKTLEFAGDATRREVLGVFERKKGGFVPVAEEPDPVLSPKKKAGDSELP